MVMLNRALMIAVSALSLTAGAIGARAADENDLTRWEAIREALFANRPIEDGGALMALEAPYRAEDAAVVPITMRAGVPQSLEKFIKTVHLIVDNNPSPVAGVFHFNPGHGSATIATRLRVDEYTHIRAVAETNDGRLFMASRYVKAAGGCSAPAGKDQELAMARLGKMKLVLPETVTFGQPVTAQVLISHPNNSGLQYDQISGFYTPAHYVQKLAVTYDGVTVFEVDSDISLSEDPSIHFTFVPAKPGRLEVRAVDSKDREYRGGWDVTGGSS
jgi:sulfur-oxidizing protein SoxY